MEGHYHADFGEDEESDEEPLPSITINEPDIHKFAAELVATQRRLKRPAMRVGFVCNFGCGHLHNLTDKDRQIILEDVKKPMSSNPNA